MTIQLFLLGKEGRMALTGKQQVDKLLQKGRAAFSIGDCGICHKPITDEHPDEVRMVDGEPVHEDCYFDELGAEVERHPIGHPGMR